MWRARVGPAPGLEIDREQLLKLGRVLGCQVDLDSLPVVNENVSLVGFDALLPVREVQIV
jgi:hypothetical protein